MTCGATPSTLVASLETLGCINLMGFGCKSSFSLDPNIREFQVALQSANVMVIL